MPRVVSESSVSAQVAASRPRSTGEPRGGGSEPFAQLLPDAEPVARDSAPQTAKRVDEGKAATPADRPAEEKRPGETDQPDGGAQAGTDTTSADPAAPTIPTIPTISPVDAISIAMPQPAPDITPSAPALIAAPVATLTGAPEAAAPPTIPPPVPPAVPPAVDPTATEDLKLGPPLLKSDAPPMPGKTNGQPADAGQEPAVIAEGKPLPQPKPPLVQADSEKLTGPALAPTTIIARAVAKPAAELTRGETGKSTSQGEAEAKADTLAAKGEDSEPAAPAKKAHPKADIRAPAPNPASTEVRAPDIKPTPTLDLATAAIQSAPSSPSATHSAPAPAPAPAPTVASAPVPFSGLAVAIAANAQGGRTRFDIRLDPPELGRIDVRLHFDSRGHVTSHLIVDRSETLDLLRRDAVDLERSLQQAGLKTSDDGLQFSLRDQSSHSSVDKDEPAPAAQIVVADPEPTIDPMMRGYLRAGQGAGLDIRV